MQVVPVYGMRSVLPASSMLPVPLTEKVQFGMPGMLPDPLIAIVTVVGLTSSPCADAETTMPFPQLAVNVPAIVVAVCEAIWYWKLPQLLGLGSVTSLDTH